MNSLHSLKEQTVKFLTEGSNLLEAIRKLDKGITEASSDKGKIEQEINQLKEEARALKEANVRLKRQNDHELELVGNQIAAQRKQADEYYQQAKLEREKSAIESKSIREDRLQLKRDQEELESRIKAFNAKEEKAKAIFA